MRRRTLLQGSLLGMLPWLATAQAMPVMHVTTLVGDDPLAALSERILGEAYSRLGRQLMVHQLPGERSLMYANEGKMDGELYRKHGIDRAYPNLVLVPVALLTSELVIFTRGTSFPVHGWDSLRPFTFGYVRGNKIVQENTVGMKAEPVSTLQQAFEKMVLGRTELVLGLRLSGMAVIKALGLEGVTVLEPPLASFPMYHYVHKKHADLVPELTRVLKQMQADRTIERLQHAIQPA